MPAEMTLQEFEQKRAEIKSDIVSEIATSIKYGYAPFLKDRNALENQKSNRPYNASNGLAMEGMNSLLADIKKEKFAYPTNQWLSINDAQRMGVSQEAIDKITNKETWAKEYGNKALQVHYIQRNEKSYVPKLDEKGNTIPLLDENGQQRIGKNGKPLVEYELDEKGHFKTQSKPLETPRLRTELLYNIEEFKKLDPNIEKLTFKNGASKILPINESQVNRHILNNTQNEERTRVFYSDIEKTLLPNTAKNIKEYFNAQNFERGYKAPERKPLTQQESLKLDNAISQNEQKANQGKQKVQEDIKVKLNYAQKDYAKQQTQPAPQQAKKSGRGR